MTCSETANTLLMQRRQTGDTSAADMKQISIWLANKAGQKQITRKQIARTMTCSKSQQPMYLGHANETTPMVHADDTGQITM